MECLYVCVFAPSPPGAEGPKTGLKAPKRGQKPPNWGRRPPHRPRLCWTKVITYMAYFGLFWLVL